MTALEQSEPRYDKVIGVLLYLCLLALLVLPARGRHVLGGIAAGTATVLMAMAGVVAGLALDEAVSLVAGGALLLCLGGVARLTGRDRTSSRPGPVQRPAEP